jgi:glucose/mannose-6-phosphate isomerase
MTTTGALDDRKLMERLDPSGLISRIEALPEQCEEAWRHASAFELSAAHREANAVIVLGMGGSAIAGDIFRALAFSSQKPVHVVRGYGLPAFAGGETLVIACSHSGNTEETLSAFEQALAAKAKVVALTMGGRLGDLASANGVPAMVYRYDGEPRSALGHQLMALLGVGQQAGCLSAQDAAVQEAVRTLRQQRELIGSAVPAGRNPAKQLASKLHGRLPVVVGAGVLIEAARRWKTQFNENSKCWAISDELPELDHNTIVGFGLTKDVVRRLHVVFLSHPALGQRMLRRIELTAEALSDAGVTHERVEAAGAGPLAQALTSIFFGDLVSYYLALLNGVDPAPVGPITKLKDGLAAG